MIEVLLAFFIVLVTIVIVVKFNTKKSSKKANILNGKIVPKVPGAIPILGHGVAFGTDPEKFLNECKRKFGTPFEINLAGNEMIIIDGQFRKEYFSAPDSFLNFLESVKAVTAAEHTIGLDTFIDQWHTPIIRKQFAGSLVIRFSTKLLKALSIACSQQIPNCGEVGKKCTVPSIEPLAWACIAACSAKSFLGDELGAHKAVQEVFVSFHKKCFKMINLAAVAPNFVLKLFAADVEQDKRIIRELVVPEVLRRRGHFNITPENKNKVEAEPERDLDLLHYMIDYCDPATGELLAPEAVAARVMTMIFASMVTTAGVLNHCLWDLAGRGDILLPLASGATQQQTLWEGMYEEQVEVLRKTGELSHEAVESMPLLTSFIRESIRMASGPFQHTRICKKDGLLAGYLIEEGKCVFLSGLLTNRDPNLFNDPETFNPLRFIELAANGDPASSDTLNLHHFGIGRHVCPGRSFANNEIKFAIVLLMQNYRFKTKSGQVPKYRVEPSSCERHAEEVVFERIHCDFEY